MPDPTQLIDITNVLDAYQQAGKPADALPKLRQYVQSRYDQLNQQGFFKDPANASIGHALRQQLYVSDPSQGFGTPPPQKITPAPMPTITQPQLHTLNPTPPQDFAIPGETGLRQWKGTVDPYNANDPTGAAATFESLNPGAQIVRTLIPIPGTNKYMTRITTQGPHGTQTHIFGPNGEKAQKNGSPWMVPGQAQAIASGQMTPQQFGQAADAGFTQVGNTIAKGATGLAQIMIAGNMPQNVELNPPTVVPKGTPQWEKTLGSIGPDIGAAAAIPITASQTIGDVARANYDADQKQIAAFHAYQSNPTPANWKAYKAVERTSRESADKPMFQAIAGAVPSFGTGQTWLQIAQAKSDGDQKRVKALVASLPTVAQTYVRDHPFMAASDFVALATGAHMGMKAMRGTPKAAPPRFEIPSAETPGATPTMANTYADPLAADVGTSALEGSPEEAAAIAAKNGAPAQTQKMVTPSTGFKEGDRVALHYGEGTHLDNPLPAPGTQAKIVRVNPSDNPTKTGYVVETADGTRLGARPQDLRPIDTTQQPEPITATSGSLTGLIDHSHQLIADIHGGVDNLRAKGADLAAIEKAAEGGQPYSNANAVGVQPKATITPVNSRASFLDAYKRHMGLSPEEAQHVGTVADTRANAWAKLTGRPVDEYYKTRFAAVGKGMAGEGGLNQEAPTTTKNEFGADVLPPSGKGLFHGTSSPVTDLTQTYNSNQHQNLYGPGFYTTDSPEIAKTYMNKGRGNQPSLYHVEWTGKKPANLIDLNQPLPEDAFRVLQGHTDTKLDPGMLGKDAYKAYKNDLSDEGLTTGEAQERMHDLADEFVGKGYDGFTHTGGVGKSPHNVSIFFEPVTTQYTERVPDSSPEGFHVKASGGEAQVKLTPADQTLFDQRQGTNKGSVQFLADNRAIIRGLSLPDVSTAAHELIHVWRRDMYREGSGLTMADIKAVEKWAGVKDGNWTTAAEEKFARGGERHLAEGSASWAPPAVQKAFEAFKKWMAHIYKAVLDKPDAFKGTPIDVDINQVRHVYEKLMGKGTEEWPNASAPRPVSFETSKGSTYMVDADGRTTRTKTAHAGHETADVGVKDKSDKTYYVSPEDSQRIGMHGAMSGKKTVRVSQDGKQALLLGWNEAAGKWGISPSEKAAGPVTLHDVPAVGLHPVELWNGQGGDYGKWHPGNAITSIIHDEPASATATTPGKYIGSLNRANLNLHPDAESNVLAVAKSEGLDNKQPATIAQMSALAKSLNLSPDDLKEWPVGQVPATPKGMNPDTWGGVWNIAVRDLHAAAQEAHRGAKADTLDAREEYLNTPTMANKLSLARTAKAEKAAKADAHSLQIHDDKLAEKAGRQLSVYNRLADPTMGTGYKAKLAEVPSLAEAMKPKAVKNGARPANSVSDPALQAAIDAWKASKPSKPLAQADTLYQSEDPLATIGRYHFEDGKTTLPAWRAAVEKSIGEPLKLADARAAFDNVRNAVAEDIKSKQIAAAAPVLKDQLAGELGRKGAEQFLNDLSDTTRDKVVTGQPVEAFTPTERQEIAHVWDLSTPERLKTSTKQSDSVVKQIVKEAKTTAPATFEDLVGRRVAGGKQTAAKIKADLEGDGTGKDAIDALMNAPETLTKEQSQRLARALDAAKKINKPSNPNAVTLRLTRLMRDARMGKLDLTTGKAETLAHFQDKYTREAMAKAGTKDKNASEIVDAVAEKMKPIEAALAKVADDDFPGQAEVVNQYDREGLDKWSTNLATIYRANLLSNPASLVAIMASHVASNIMERSLVDPLAALADANYVRKNGGPRAIATNIKDVGTAAKSIPQGFKTAGAVMRGGESAVHLGRAQGYALPSSQLRSDFETGLGKLANQVSDPRLAAALRTTGKIIDAPVRFFTRQHGAAFSVPGVPLYEQALRDAARSKAVGDGLKGAEQDAAAAKYYETRPEDMQKLADANFMEKMFVNPNKFNDLLNQLGEHGPFSRLVKTLIAPFAKIPSNIAGRAIEAGPVGLFKGLEMMSNAEMMKDPVYRANAYRSFTRGALGSITTLIAYEYAQSHNEQDGKKPLMQGINVAEHRYMPTLNLPGDNSVGLGRLAPFINPLSAGLTLGDRKANASDVLQAVAGESPYTSVGTTTDNLFPDADASGKIDNKAGVTATDTLAQKMLKYGKSTGNKFGAQVVKGFIPGSSLLNAVAAERDRPNGMRQKQTFGDQIANIIPGPPAKIHGQAITRQGLPLLHDRLNQVVPESGGLAALPITKNTVRLSPIQQRYQALQELQDQLNAAKMIPVPQGDRATAQFKHELGIYAGKVDGNLKALKLEKNPTAYGVTPGRLQQLEQPPTAQRLQDMDRLISRVRAVLATRR